jgi:hypothetical protein
MSDAELIALDARRTAALGAMPTHRVVPRARADAISAEFRSADAAIVAELRRRAAPAALGEVTLWLTSDRLNFVHVETATGHLLHARPSERSHIGAALLFDYSAARA